MYKNSFHNTIDASGVELENYEQHMNRQELAVYNFIKNNPRPEGYTAPEAHEHVLQDCPEVSVRRSMTNLKEKMYLVMTSQKRPGRYGTPNHAYQLTSWKEKVNASVKSEENQEAYLRRQLPASQGIPAA